MHKLFIAFNISVGITIKMRVALAFLLLFQAVEIRSNEPPWTVCSKNKETELPSTPEPPRSCLTLKRESPSAQDGIYRQDDGRNNFYCDMTTDGGGWTLVGSVVDPNYKVHCNATQDTWTNLAESGKRSLWGKANSVNRNVNSAASSDFKSRMYSGIRNATNVMIWHLPYGTRLNDYSSSAYLKYYTTNGFLANFGESLYHFFRDHFPLEYQKFSWPNDAGPAYPVTFAKGGTNDVLELYGPNTRNYIFPGYIQFRVVDPEQNSFALCPGIKVNPDFQRPGNVCIGSYKTTSRKELCGDFGGLYTDSDQPGTGWSASTRMLKSAIFIFVR